jgi:DNA repair protein RadC
VKAPAKVPGLLPHVRLVREVGSVVGLGSRIRAADDAVKILRPILDPEEVEVFLVLFLNTRSAVTGYSEVTRGILDSSLVHPRECFRAAIAAGAAGIIVAHNHPSGDPTPSAEDRMITRQLVAAGKILDIPVYDHIILAGQDFTSLAREGLI